MSPSKLEILTRWIPNQAWYVGPAEPVFTIIGSFRFDDPMGEVGVESILVHEANGTLFHVPLTYRGAPVEETVQSFLSTMSHSVLGPRWIYDAATDPVYVAALGAVFDGLPQAVEIINADGVTWVRDPFVRVSVAGIGVVGFGTDRTYEVIRIVQTEASHDGAGSSSNSPHRLVATWENQTDPVTLVIAR
jgi:Maltokinase N-terminal cap domain